MNGEQPTNAPTNVSNDTCQSDTFESQKLNENEQAKQDAYRREYLEQLRRRACPDCGEGDPIF